MSCCKADSSPVAPSTRLIQQLSFGIAADVNAQGRDKGMEDEYVALLNHADGCSFFAVYDGHGGSVVANYAKRNLHETFFKKIQGILPDENDLKTVWEDTYAVIDEDIRMRLTEPDVECVGCTSTTLFVAPEHDGWLISTANVGDSNALYYSTQGSTCRFFTTTHRPTDEHEITRVKEAGGYISGEKSKRLNGRLAVTRALGDHFIKRTTKGLISAPSVGTIHMQSPGVLVMASDGLWDFAEEETKRYLLSYDVMNMDPNVVARALLDIAISKKSNDNIAIIVVKFEKKVVPAGEAGSPIGRMNAGNVRVMG